MKIDEDEFSGGPSRPSEAEEQENITPAKTETNKTETKKSNGTLNLNIEDTQEFLSEINRTSTILEKAHDRMQSIEENTAVVYKLKQISELDMSSFKSKIEDTTKSLSLEKILEDVVKESLGEVIKPAENAAAQLKNLIFELEKLEDYNKFINRFKIKIVSVMLIFSVILGFSVGYFSGDYVVSNGIITSNIKKTYDIPKNAQIYDYSIRKWIKSPSNINMKNTSNKKQVKRKSGIYIIFNFKGNKYGILKKNINNK